MSKPEFRIGVSMTTTEMTCWSIDRYRGRIVIGHDAIRRGTLPPLNALQWQAIVNLLGPDRQGHRPTFYRVGARGAYRRVYGVKLKEAS